MLKILADRHQAVAFAAEHFLTLAKKAIHENGRFAVALSGGSTPKAIYQLLSAPPLSQRIDWTKVWLFWSDERPVPPLHPQSNYHMAIDAGLGSLGIPEEQIIRMKAEGAIEEEAMRYEECIEENLSPTLFDLVMLGLGEDGHVASLFPHTAALQAKDRLIVANYVPAQETWRMTLTFSCINRSRAIAIYAFGAAKQEILRRVLQDKEDLPANKIDERKALWILDRDAAALLTNQGL